MKRIHGKKWLLFALLGLLSGGSLQAFAQASTDTVNQDIPYDETVFVSCANGGAGEFVHLTGELHELWHATANASGGFRVALHINPKGVTGLGLSTGLTYRATGGEHFSLTVHDDGGNETYMLRFNVIGQGPDNNFTVHETGHVTVNANGEVTANFDNISVECQ